MTIKHHPNNQPDPTPGLKSPLFWGTFLLGTGMLFFGKDSNEHDRAVYMLAIAGTALLTNNTIARGASIIGGAMRLSSSALLGTLGFLTQGAAVGYSVVTSLAAAKKMQSEAEERSSYRPA